MAAGPLTVPAKGPASRVASAAVPDWMYPALASEAMAGESKRIERGVEHDVGRECGRGVPAVLLTGRTTRLRRRRTAAPAGRVVKADATLDALEAPSRRRNVPAGRRSRGGSGQVPGALCALALEQPRAPPMHMTVSSRSPAAKVVDAVTPTLEG